MIFINGLRGVSARVLMTKTGAWYADVDVDLELVPLVPSGRVALTIGVNVLSGTVDARASGRFGTKARVRVVGGGGGWDTIVPALHLHNDAGVLSSAVYAAIGATVGETVVELGPPAVLGVDFAFMRGPASTVFAGVKWWIDALGVTFVGPRPPLPVPPIAEVLTWDPKAMVAEIASDVLIVPGMVLTDPIRFGVATVDDVEHTFSEGSARAIAWCSVPSPTAIADESLAPPMASGGAKVVQALANMARQAAGSATLKRYPYRVVVQAPDGRLNLQSVELGGDVPPFLTLIDIWAGVPGLSVKLVPSSVVLVSFVDRGEPGKQQPVVVGFDPDAPPSLEWSVDALRIVLGSLGVDPIAKATGLLVALNAIQAEIAAIGAYAAAVAIVSPLTVPAAATLATALTAGTTAVSAALTTIPSTKSWTD